jgi:hypothetical protein
LVDASLTSVACVAPRVPPPVARVGAGVADHHGGEVGRVVERVALDVDEAGVVRVDRVADVGRRLGEVPPPGLALVPVLLTATNAKRNEPEITTGSMSIMRAVLALQEGADLASV